MLVRIAHLKFSSDLAPGIVAEEAYQVLFSILDL